jgi:hypothetical protein
VPGQGVRAAVDELTRFGPAVCVSGARNRGRAWSGVVRVTRLSRGGRVGSTGVDSTAWVRRALRLEPSRIGPTPRARSAEVPPAASPPCELPHFWPTPEPNPRKFNPPSRPALEPRPSREHRDPQPNFATATRVRPIRGGPGRSERRTRQIQSSPASSRPAPRCPRQLQGPTTQPNAPRPQSKIASASARPIPRTSPITTRALLCVQEHSGCRVRPTSQLPCSVLSMTGRPRADPRDR